MKKRIMSLVLALVLALGLCAGASAAEASLLGVLGDGGELTWSIDGGVLRVDAGQGWTGSVFAACYNNKGRLTEIRVLTPDKPSAPVSPWVTRAKLFWTGEGLAPKCEPIQTRLAPDKVITQGVKSWYNLTDPHSINYYVAPGFAPDCVYTLNDAEAELSAVQSAAAKRGAVTEFELNDDGLISAVTCYDYTVCQEDGQVSFCYTAPDGALVIDPVTEKITGKVTAFSTKGELTINGTHYKATELTVEGCGVDVSENGFRNWGLLGEGAFLNTYDFYLDKSGSICWVEQFDSMDANDVCLVLDARASGDGRLQASILFADSSTKTVDVVRLDRQDITDADAAGQQLRAKGKSTFYTWKLTPSGYELLEMGAGHESWDTPVSVGDGTSVVAQIFKESAFAKDPSNPSYPLQDMLYSDSKTVFIVGKELPSGEMNYTTYKGFKTVPEMNATIVTAVAPRAEHGPNGAARCVYLQSNQCLPEGLVYISDNTWLIDPELYEDGVYLTHIVDTDGTETQMRLPNRLKDAVVGNASMEIGRFDRNAYVGKFCAVTGIDENHVVTGLEPVDANHVSALGNGVITTSAGTWTYDEYTVCVYVDLGWIDDPNDAANRLGVREDRDLYRVNASGAFDPDNFFVPGDVSADPADKTPFRSVKAVVVSAPGTPGLADYIYVVRELW